MLDAADQVWQVDQSRRGKKYFEVEEGCRSSAAMGAKRQFSNQNLGSP